MKFLKIFLCMVGSILSCASCTKEESPKGRWVYDCGIQQSRYGEYRQLIILNLDLSQRSIKGSDYDENLCYGTIDNSNINRIYRSDIDSVENLGDNIYVIHSIDQNWNMRDVDTLTYNPDNKTIQLTRFPDLTFVQDNSDTNVNNEEIEYAEKANASSSATEEKGTLVYWIIGVAALLLIVQIYMNFSDEYDAWIIVLALTTVLAILSSIVGYRILILHYVPEQLNPGPEDGAMGYLKMVAGLAVVAVSYFWSFKNISKGLIEDGAYVPLGCFKCALALLVISALFGMSSDFKIFLDIYNDFIPCISFQNGVLNGIVSVLMVLILLLTVIQIVKFFKSLPTIPAVIATILLPVIMAGGIAMCLSCIPLLIISVIAIMVFGMFKGASEAQSHPSPEMTAEEMRRDFINSNPSQIQITEGGCPIDLYHTGCGIYRSSDGRKFEKTGDSVEEKFD